MRRGPSIHSPILAREARKQRAAKARGHAALERTWSADARLGVQRTIWRIASTWVEQSDGTHCAELIHGSTGKRLVIRQAGSMTAEARRNALTAQLL